MKIATWNVNSLKVRLGHVLEWLDIHKPDVLGLQETKLTDDKFPIAEIEQTGYTCVFAGQKTYNGVAVLSRNASTNVITDVPGLDDPARRILAVDVGGVRVINLYVVNGQEVGSDKYVHKLHWLEQVTAYVRAELERNEHVCVIGDFNIAPEERDVHDPDAWRDKILCSGPEREALAKMMGVELIDVFRSFEQPPRTFSWWDYRAAGFRRNQGLRIDLILASRALADSCTECIVDTAPRKLERPSDHAPVVAEFSV